MLADPDGSNASPLSVSAIFTASEQRLDLIVIAEEKYEQFRRPVLKNETQRIITSTVEDLICEFPGRCARPAGQMSQATRTAPTGTRLVRSWSGAALEEDEDKDKDNERMTVD